MENNKKNYPKMDRLNRAKQFMPFDALKGFREALAKQERLALERENVCQSEEGSGIPLSYTKKC